MFEIHYRRKISSEKDFTLIAKNISTLVEARKLRSVSGDLVVYAKDHQIVTNEEWLFDYELNDDSCYAKKAIAWQKNKNMFDSLMQKGFAEFEKGCLLKEFDLSDNGSNKFKLVIINPIKK